VELTSGRDEAGRGAPGAAAFAAGGSAADLFAATGRALRAAAADELFCERVAHANTTASLSVAGSDHGLTLRLDRTPIEVHDEVLPDTEVQVFGGERELAQILAWELPLGLAIARGKVTFTGPVRKLLCVMPVLHHACLPDAERPPAPADDPGGPLVFEEDSPGDFWSVRCENLVKRFGSDRALDGLSLEIPEGMVTVVLGPSGAGKSVLIRHVLGLIRPDHGDVVVHGSSVPNMHTMELQALRRKFGILFQDGALFGSLNAYDNVAFPLREQTDTPEQEIHRIVMQRLAEVGLSGAAGLMPNQLSGGMRKRVGFARALVLEPEIVVFDEPDSGLDPVRTALLCDLIRGLHAEHGGTYIVITHDIASTHKLADYIAVLWNGRIEEAGLPEQVFNSENPFVRQFLTGAVQGPLGMDAH
jgi:phospholipid/cholesterol/gamma-HCH transport system ATP-binding protein